MGRTANGEGVSSEQKKYLGLPGAWALAFGCSVGWGSFVMPGTTFLPVAGPIGTSIGLVLGGLVMLLLAVNYHYLMNKYPDGGGTYSYTKNTFGYDHGFLSAWFLILTYVAVIWGNATALPLIARTLLGDTFRVGYLYEIVGYPIYLGELFLALSTLVLAALVCFFRRTAAFTQIIVASILFMGVIICFAVATSKLGSGSCTPAFATDKSATAGVIKIFALSPWAFVGFESISHSAAEAKFDLKKSFLVLFISIVTSIIAYVLLVLLAVKSLPADCNSWVEYVTNLSDYSGIESQPTFHTAYVALGEGGKFLLGAAALGAIFTGLVGNYIALSRLLDSVASDGFFPKWMGKKSGLVPRNALIAILIASAIFPFFGRNAISWIVDVTSIGATIAYALASASTWKTAKDENNKKYKTFGVIGIVIAVLFALAFLIPNLLSVSTLSTEAYLILSVWCVAGFLCFRIGLQFDRQRRLGKSIVAWVVLLGLIIFTSSIWMHQTVNSAFENYRDDFGRIDRAIHTTIIVHNGLIVFSLLILLNIYSVMLKREKAIEVEKARAEETSRAKTSFLSNMSHEIRTPMNAIIGLKNVALRDPDLSPNTRLQLEKIGSSANHLLGVINDILDMSRIESGRVVVKNEEFSFSEFLDQINTIIGGQCQEKHLKYELSVADNVAEYYIGDDLRLKQVLINILGNAVKFTKFPGTVSLTIEQSELQGNSCRMKFIMSDTGVGMDADYLPKIFDSFSMEDESNTTRYGGSGLGMAITKNLVDMMQGEISVESEKDVGTTFTVVVPLEIKKQVSEREATSKLSKLSYEIISETISGRRVLIAEDVDQNAEILSDLLDLEEVKSARARNGEDAMLMFSKSEPGFYSAILMDVRMPVMDGLASTRAIRKMDHPDAKDIPIIALTANALDEDVDRSLDAGMNAHLSKPVEADLLYETMARLIIERGEKEVD